MTYDELIARLRMIAAEVDGPPYLIGDNARAALSTRRLDSELAELIADSAAAEATALREDQDGLRLLSFETDTVSLELQVTEVAGQYFARGLVSGASGEVVVETARERRIAPIDPQGWFTIADFPTGVVRLRVQDNDETTVTTSWVVV